MFSRKTLLLSVAPSLALVIVAPLYLVPSNGLWLTITLLAAYVLGLPIGMWAARRYGKLVKPFAPLF